MSNLCTNIRASLIQRGACFIGYADVSNLSHKALAGFKNAVSIAVALNPSIISDISKGPTKKYYQEYNRANDLLADLCNHAVDIIIKEGHKAFAPEPTIKIVDLNNLDTILPHKTIATKAGFGWIGKSALLITKRYGAAVRLATVLTDAKLDVAEPVEKSMCGDCRQCADHCPANAIKGNNWKLGASRDSIYDAFVCCDTAAKLSSQAGIKSNIGKVVICGICINVCPWTQKYISRKQNNSEKIRTLKIISAQTNEDFQNAKKILSEYIDSLGFDLSFQNIQQELADLPNHFTSPEEYFLLAINENQIVGCVALKRLDTNICEMERLYVKPKFRGLGIGRELAESVIKKAKNIGYDFMRLHTVLPRVPARNLYFSLGFRDIEPYQYNPMEKVAFMELKLT